MAMKKNKGVKEYSDGKGGKWIRDYDSDNHIHIDDKGNANVFDHKKKKKG